MSPMFVPDVLIVDTSREWFVFVKRSVTSCYFAKFPGRRRKLSSMLLLLCEDGSLVDSFRRILFIQRKSRKRENGWS